MYKKLCVMLALLLVSIPVLGQKATFETTYDQIFSMSYAPDGSAILVSSFEAADDGTDTLVTSLQIFDGNEGELFLELTSETHQPLSFALSPDSSVLVTGAQNGEVALWDMETLEIVTTFPAHESVPEILFTADGTKMITGDSSGIMVWDVETVEPMLVLSPQDIETPQLLSVLVSPDNSLVAGVYAPDVLVFWDITEGEELLRQMTGYELEPYAALFVPDETRSEMLLAYDDDIEVRDVLDNSITATYDTEIAYAMAFSPDGSVLATADLAGDVMFWDTATQQFLYTTMSDIEFAHALAFSPDGSQLAVAHDAGMVSVFSVE